MASGTFVYALDFDGVICDSAQESSRSAFLAAKRLWPQLPLPSKPTDEFPSHLVLAMRSVRPIIETGYENALLARMLSETDPEQVQSQFVDPVMKDWPTIREGLMQSWDVKKEALIDAFDSVRDDWISEDETSWLTANKFFPDIASAINSTLAPVFIITTKRTRFVQLLLQHNGISIPEANIFGLGSGSKISSLKTVIGKPEHAGMYVIFVEDRYETLEKVSLSMLGQPLQMFLATWGYNTQDTRDLAEKHPFITTLGLPTFITKLQ